MKLGTRLTLTYLGITGLAILPLGIYILASFERFFLASERADLDAHMTSAGETVAEWMEAGDLVRARLIVQRYGVQEGVTLRLFSPAGALVASSDVADADDLRDWGRVPDVRAALGGTAVAGRAVGLRGGEERLFESRPLVRDGKLVGVLRISQALTEFNAQRRGARLALVGALLLTFAVCAVITAVVARGLARPIQRMRDFALSLGKGEFGGRLEIARPDELGELARQLNQMGARLKTLDDERRSFLVNASHELRTPISNVHVTIEALLQGAGEDPELRTRFLETALGETRRMTTRIQELLDLGRLEAGVVPIERQQTSLRHLVERAARAMETRTSSSEVTIAVRADDLLVAVDVERMLRALLNVLDNALKFAPRGSTIVIESKQQGASATMAISDEGPGIEPQDLPRIFEQFYTADRSRRRGGTGLGLAIARRIVEAHGGTITAASPPGHGAVFTIALPMVQAPLPAPESS